MPHRFGPQDTIPTWKIKISKVWKSISAAYPFLVLNGFQWAICQSRLVKNQCKIFYKIFLKCVVENILLKLICWEYFEKVLLVLFTKTIWDPLVIMTGPPLSPLQLSWNINLFWPYRKPIHSHFSFSPGTDMVSPYPFWHIRSFLTLSFGNYIWSSWLIGIILLFLHCLP